MAKWSEKRKVIAAVVRVSWVLSKCVVKYGMNEQSMKSKDERSM